MSPHLCVIVFWVRAAVSLCCPLWSLGPAGNLECAPQLGRDIQLIHFLVSENGNAKLDILNRVKVPRVRGAMFGEGEDIIRNQGDYDGRGQRSCKCNYVDFSK